jgi:hypothetical protein
MRSRLEARYAGWLDRHELVWRYEPQCFADEIDQYLPDFAVECRIWGVECTVYIEVKPTQLTSIELDRLLGRFGIIWRSTAAPILLEIEELTQPVMFFPDGIFPDTRLTPEQVGARSRWAAWSITKQGLELIIAPPRDWR